MSSYKSKYIVYSYIIHIIITNFFVGKNLMKNNIN